MKEFYTNVELKGNNILLRGWNQNKRVQKTIPYKPYLYIPSKTPSEITTVQNEPVKRVDFPNVFEARDFLKKYKDVEGFQIYGVDKFVYTFISDYFKGSISYNPETIRVVYLDIEVDSENGFPDIDQADKHITAITMRTRDTRVVLGLKDFDINKTERIPESDRKNIRYFKCKNELYLLKTFIALWEQWDPDVITGWNIEFFDIPYIVRRIRAVLGEDQAKKLSPWHRLIERNVVSRGKEHEVFVPAGVAILDYVQLYKKFTYSQRESYALNYIAHVELDEKKMDYSEYGSLNELYQFDHQKFIEYNIIDTDLVFRLEQKMRLIELVYAIAYDAKVNFSDALGSVLLWDIIIYNYLKEHNMVVSPPTKKRFRPFEGAYVKDPQVGMHDWVVSFDLTSLYPHLIMQYNISPETFEGKDPNPESVDDLLEWLEKSKDGYHGDQGMHEVSIAANGCTYSRDKTGFLPALMALQFRLRDEYKKKMLEIKKNDPTNKMEIAKFNNFQMAKKIQLNSAYGAIANEWFRWYDPDHAEAITISGQLSIRWIANAVNRFMNEKLGTVGFDYIIAIDTDSIYVKCADLVEGLDKELPLFKYAACDLLDKFAKEEMEPFMKKSFDELARKMNAKNRMYMKREAIADRAIWRAKKNYIANVWDNEGVRFKEPELKMMGIEAVRSSTPQVCRDKIKETLKLIISTDEETVRTYIAKFREEWEILPFEEIAFPRSVKGISKYSDGKGYKAHTPIHVKASILHNNLLRKHKLVNTLTPIYDFDKIKWAYMKMPNPTMEEVIATSTILPKQFGLDDYIDRELQFEKAFLSPIKSILDAIGWELEKRATLEALFG